jgi:hypothetical protein
MYRLLRFSAVPRANFCMRNSPPALSAAAVEHWDDVMSWALEHSLGLQPALQSWEAFVEGGARYALAALARVQAALPPREGGLAIPKAAELAPAAYAGACCLTVPQVLGDWRRVVEPADDRTAVGSAATRSVSAAAASLPAVRAWAQALHDAFPEGTKGFSESATKVLKGLAGAGESEPLEASLRRAMLPAPDGIGGGLAGVQHKLAAAAAHRAGDALVAQLEEAPGGERRDQDLVRIASLRRARSVGLAFLNDHMLRSGEALEGLPFQLTMRRLLGIERELARCGLCGAAPGGSLHARYCRAATQRGHDIYVHDRVKDCFADLISTICHVPVIKESRVPFLAFAGVGGVDEMRMDIYCPDGSFAGKVFGHAPGLMLDTAVREPQAPSWLARALVDPVAPCAAAQTLKRSCYSGHYDPNCDNLATTATGTFGVLSEGAEKLVGVLANAWADNHGSEHGPSPKALRSVGLCRVRAALSAALHAGVTQRVMTYMATPGVRGASGVGAQESEFAARVRDPPWVVAP